MNPHLDSLASRLDLEWAHLRTARRPLQVARSWWMGTDDPLDRLLVGLDDLGTIVGATQRGAGERAGDDDLVMLRLVAIARHEQLASRVLVQRLLPGLIARTRGYRGQDRLDPLDAVVPAACVAIGRYDMDRRPRHVAASLISDAVDRGLRQPARRCSATEVVRSPHAFADAPASERVTAIEELAAIVEVARLGGVADGELELVRELVRYESPTIVAQRHAVTTRTIRNRRDRAVAHIRDALSIAA